MDHNQKSIVTVTLGLIAVCVISPLSIPAEPVPVTLQTLILFLMTGIFGKKKGTLIAVLYLICGAIGFPVFSDFSSGLQKFTGPTAGFIWAFPFMCYLLGWLIEKYPKRYITYIFSFILVHLFLLIIGFLVLMIITGTSDFPIQNMIYLFPGLIIKSIVGGILSLWLSKQFNQ